MTKATPTKRPAKSRRAPAPTPQAPPTGEASPAAPAAAKAAARNRPAEPKAAATKAPSGEPEGGGRRRIVDRGPLKQRIHALHAASERPEEARPAILAEMKQAMEAGRQEIRRRFEAGSGGREAARSLSFLADQIIRTVWDHVTADLYPLANPSAGERLAIIAVGGYGRGELAPFSDVDILFLLPWKMTPRSEQVVEAVLYYLWDLGFKVGQATRSIDDCIRHAKADQTIRTNLLEARFIWGDQGLYLELKQRFAIEVQVGQAARFIEAKLAERDERHQRQGGSRYSLEPNIKEGKGGLRDLHTLFWIAKFAYRVERVESLVEQGVLTREEVRRFAKAADFLWTLRCHLHWRAGRAEERLTFDLQKDLAPLMGYTQHAGTEAVERFMKHYFLVAKDVGALTRIFCAQLESSYARRGRFRLPALERKRKVEGFPLSASRLTVEGPQSFKEAPIEMLRIFEVAQRHDLDIHPDALRWITQNRRLVNAELRADPQANELFLDMLSSEKGPETTLRRLNEAGLFGRFVPDFGRVVSQMQFNMYHHYTVDEHTIFALSTLWKIEQGLLQEEAPIASDVVHKVLSRRLLYVAILLHDIAKGRPGDHSEIGAEIALKLCPRLGLSDEETETVSWLVLHHLDMSDTAFKRDLDEPETIRAFSEKVQSMERLRLLLVLTVADIRAVGPGTWTPWKAALLRDLYWRTEEVLSGGLVTEGREQRVKAAQQALREALAGWSERELKAHLKRGYPSYWLSHDAETHARHARLVREAEAAGQSLTIDTRIDRYRGVTEITIYTPDHPGLFSRIAGALAVAGAEIEAAKIFTLANGMALDSFYVKDRQQGGAFERPDRLAKLASLIERTLRGNARPWVELKERRSAIPSRLAVFTVAPRVLIDNNASRNHTVIEVNGRDRTGFLHDVTHQLTKLGLIIHNAFITTFGERAVDSFYVQDALGSKIVQPAKLERIRKRLIEAIEPEKAETRKAESKRKVA